MSRLWYDVGMTRIALISDTHNHLPDEALELTAGSDHIIHAGDICEPRILMELECIAPVTAVLGNNDYADFGPCVNPIANRVIDGVRFVVAHKPIHLQQALEGLGREDGYPIVGVYGHKHVPYLACGDEAVGCDVKVSPGSVFRSRDELGRRTLGFVEIDDDKIGVSVIDLDGNVVFEETLQK